MQFRPTSPSGRRYCPKYATKWQNESRASARGCKISARWQQRLAWQTPGWWVACARRRLAIQSVWVLIQLRHTKAVKNGICRFPTSRRRMGTALDGERWTSKPSSPTCHAVYARVPRHRIAGVCLNEQKGQNEWTSHSSPNRLSISRAPHPTRSRDLQRGENVPKSVYCVFGRNNSGRWHTRR